MEVLDINGTLLNVGDTILISEGQEYEGSMLRTAVVSRFTDKFMFYDVDENWEKRRSKHLCNSTVYNLKPQIKWYDAGYEDGYDNGHIDGINERD